MGNNKLMILNGIKNYLMDWRNLLSHSIMGIFFLAAAIWVPIDIKFKLIIIAILVSYNIWRMNSKKKKKEEETKNELL